MMNDILREILAPVVAVTVSTVALYIGALARKYVKVASAALADDLDETARKRLEDAYMNAIAKAETAAGTVDLARAVEYVEKFNPGDLARLGLDNPVDLADRIKATISRKRAG